MSGNFERVDFYSDTKKYIRFDIDNQFLFVRKIYGNHLRMKFRPFHYFYLETDYFELLEYNNIDGEDSHLSLISSNFYYDRIRFGRFDFGWALGVNYIASENSIN